MPALMNLRSVVAQVGRSMGSRRSFSASPNVENEVEAAGKTVGSLFVSYIGSGFCFYVGGECLRGLEYFAKMYKLRELKQESVMLEYNREMIKSARKMMGKEF